MKGANISNRKGQTVIEAMVALSVLTVGFLGIVSLLSRSFFLSRTISDETTATYLAAEGVELAKNIADWERFSPDSKTGWGDCFNILNVGQHKDYGLDYRVLASPQPNCQSLGSYQKYSNDPLELDPKLNNTYGYQFPSSDRAITTKFIRDITVTLVTPTQYRITSKVSWGSQNITLEDNLYDWYP